MFKNTKVLTMIFLFIFIIAKLSTNCLAAAIPVTDENLSEAFQKFVSSESNEGNFNVSISNNIITMIGDDESVILTYDLTDKPTFIYEATIEQGMSYADFEEKTSGIINPMLGYIVVANIQGVEIEDATAYGLLSVLGTVLGGITESTYTIVDDLNVSEGVTIEKTDDTNIIYTSEFGDRVMEYVNSVYKDKQSISDSTGINSFLLTVEKKETTDTSCKIVSTLTVNLDADFSKLNGYSDMLGESFLDKNITEENADYIIKLKVGQKCKIETSEKIIGHMLFSGGCVELAEDYSEITAVRKGKANGYLYIGDKNEMKSFYIIVEENTENEDLDAITLKIDTTTTGNAPEITEEEKEEQKEQAKDEQQEKEEPDEKKEEIEQNKKEEEKDNNTITKDDTISSSGLPNTGLNDIILVMIIILTILILIIALNLKKYNDIK